MTRMILEKNILVKLHEHTITSCLECTARYVSKIEDYYY